MPRVWLFNTSNRVTLKFKKWVLFSGTVDYLGQIFRPGKQEVNEYSRKASDGLKPQRIETQLRSSFGMCNMFRRFVHNFARVAAPLNRKLRKEQPSDFGDLNEHELNALAILQKSVTRPPVSSLPPTEGKLTVDTDACDK